jgi:hypothetical protein
MRPPMPDFVTVKIPTDEVNEWGKYITNEFVFPARVANNTRTVETADGNYEDVRAEIDLPPEAIVGHGTKIVYINQYNESVEGTVITVTYAPTLRNTVLFWTVQVG